jgi:signal transduction histidine kinase
MRLGIKGKQIAGVTAIVGVAVVALSGLYVTRISGIVLHESLARAELLLNTILHRAREVVTDAPEPYSALQGDAGLSAILESSLYGESVTGASILDSAGIVIASSDPTRLGLRLENRPDLKALAEQRALDQLRVIYSPDGQTLEVQQPIVLGDEAFGSIRIGVSTLLMRQEVNAALQPALLTAAVALGVSVLVAALLAQLFLRPIHVLRSGLTRLGKGEFGVTLDLPQDDEFGELGSFFNAVSQQLSADRAAAKADQQSEQVVAFSRKLVALWRLTAGIAHEVKNPLNAMMIHLELLRTKIKTGVLEAAPQPVVASGGGLGLSTPDRPPVNPALDGALEHVHIIESEIRRLDEVVQGFLKFTRPEDLRLQPVRVGTLFEEIQPVIESEATANRVRVVVDAPASVPAAHGDAAMLRQAFLNLAINACQAMPDGGTLRLAAAGAARGTVEVRVEDTGVGISPQNLDKIFNLYYTTKEHGTGIGLSMVYRIVQMHDGELEVQSTPGRGTTFRILLPSVNEAQA